VLGQAASRSRLVYAITRVSYDTPLIPPGFHSLGLIPSTEIITLHVPARKRVRLALAPLTSSRGPRVIRLIDGGTEYRLSYSNWYPDQPVIKVHSPARGHILMRDPYPFSDLDDLVAGAS